MSIPIVAKFEVRQGEETELRRLLDELTQLSRREPGVDAFEIYWRAENDRTSVIGFEVYADDTALEAHRQSDHYLEYAPKIGGLLEGAVAAYALSEIQPRINQLRAD